MMNTTSQRLSILLGLASNMLACSSSINPDADGAGGSGGGCVVEGTAYGIDKTFKAPDACNTCTCTGAGAIECTAAPCTGGDGCYYGGAPREPGTSFLSSDGCNTCSCTDLGNVQCTAIACGGDGGDGGGLGISAGTVTLTLKVANGANYCLDDYCSTNSAISLTLANGDYIDRIGQCGVADCGTCQADDCPAMPCQQEGVAVTGETQTWDGSFVAKDTCGAGVACTEKRFMPPGNYAAVMCAYPGHVEQVEGNGSKCVHDGAIECVTVPFSFPTADPVVGTLP